MARDVVVNFKANGIGEIQRAFASLVQTLEKLERAKRGGGAGRGSDKFEAGERSRLSGGVKAVEKSEREKTRAVAREAARRDSILQRSSEMAGRLAAKQTRDEQREAGRRDAIVRRSSEMAGRFAVRQAREEASAGRTARAQMAGLVGGGAKSGLAMAARLGTGSLNMALGGGFSVGDMVQKATANRGTAADISNSGINFISGNKANHKRRTTDEIMSSTNATSIKYGLEQGDVLKGLQGFTSTTGDLDNGLKSMSQFAELARASGASFDDMANAAANVSMALPDSADKAEKVMEVMRGIAGQGKAGAMEIRDLATQMAKMVASAGKLGGDKGQAILKVGALAQMARGGGGAWNAASATTSVNAYMAAFSKGPRIAAFKDLDIKTHNDDGSIRAPEELIPEVFQKTENGQWKNGKGKHKHEQEYASQGEMLNALFGSVMADRAIQKSIQTGKAAGGGEAGKAAIAKEITDYIASASMTKTEVTENSDTRMQEADAKMAQVNARLQDAVDSKLIPALLKILPAIEKMIPTFASLIEAGGSLISWFAANPIQGIGAIIIGSIVKDMAAAGIGLALKSALGSQIGMIAGGALAAVTIGTMIVDGVLNLIDNTKKDAASEKRNVDNISEQLTTAAASSGSYDQRVRAGSDALMTPTKLAEARILRNTIVGQVTGSSGPISGSTLAGFDPSSVGNTGFAAADAMTARKVAEIAKLDAAIGAAEGAVQARAQSSAAAADRAGDALNTFTEKLTLATAGLGGFPSLAGPPGVVIQGPAPISGRPP